MENLTIALITHGLRSDKQTTVAQPARGGTGRQPLCRGQIREHAAAASRGSRPSLALMTIRYQTWWRFIRFVAGPLGLSAMVLVFVELFLEPSAKTAPLVGAAIVLALVGLSGSTVALLERFGVLVFLYTERDRGRLGYRLKQTIVAAEAGIWGDKFSARYYDNYGIQLEPGR